MSVELVVDLYDLLGVWFSMLMLFSKQNVRIQRAYNLYTGMGA
jgi:hypothetical protein